MLDVDLAQLYGVATRNLNKAVKRNASRFPSDFMFQLEKRYDARFQAVFDTIRQMLQTPVPMKKAIGFRARLAPATKPSRTAANNRKQ